MFVIYWTIISAAPKQSPRKKAREGTVDLAVQL